MYSIPQFNLNNTSFECCITNIDDYCNKQKIEYLKNLFKEIDDNYFKNGDWNKNYNSNGFAERTIITSLGTVTYKRRYYIAKDKSKNSNFYYVDKYCEFRKNVLITVDALKEILKVSSEQNCSIAAKTAIKGNPISKQTVYNYINNLKTTDEYGPVIDPCKNFDKKHSVETLYIEDDEAHCNLQKENANALKDLKETDCNYYYHCSKNIVNKLILIHEGHKYPNSDKKRKELINKAYFGGIHMDSEDLAIQAYEYIRKNYYLNKLKYIFVSGDSGIWITKFYNYLTDIFEHSNIEIVLVLDSFHTRKYLNSIFPRNKKMIQMFYDYLEEMNKFKFRQIVNDYYKQKKKEMNKSAIDALNYIIGNLEKIKNTLHKYYNCHCSMEGHVSHILAERFTSRPRGFCENVLQNITQFRLMISNGIEITTDMIKLWRSNKIIYEEFKIREKIRHKKTNSYIKKKYNFNATINLSKDASPKLKSLVYNLLHTKNI